VAPCGRRQHASACSPRCRDEQGARIRAPAACQEQGHGLGPPQSPPSPSVNRPSRAVRCERRQRTRARLPRCRDEQGALIGAPAACQELRQGPGAPQAPPPPSVNRPRGAVRCERPQRARACPPRCSAELGTPIGEPAACKRARATAVRTAVTPAAARRPPESGGQLRAASARKGLPASLQCRAGSP